MAAGKSLIDLALEFEVVAEDKKEHKIESFSYALVALGRALAELHMKASEEYSIFPLQYPFLSLISVSPLCQKLLDENEISIPTKEIDLFCEQLETLKSIHLPKEVYVYTDLNWGNTFYEESTDQITFIDTHLFHSCLNGSRPTRGPSHCSFV